MVGRDGGPRASCAELATYLAEVGLPGLEAVQRDAELSLLNQGITFTVYADERGTEKIFPLDVIPRIVTARSWARLEAGLSQRLRALNLFLRDLYGDQRILRDGVVPTDLVVNSPHFCRAMVGARAPGGVFVHVSGTDLIEDENGVPLVLEDNLRVPSGVSYVLENRIVMSRVLPDLLQRYRVRQVDGYPLQLLAALRSVSREDSPVVAVLTPGLYNSAYFEHSFLAAQMGVQLVEGRDLVVDEDVLYMKTTSGLRRVDVLYRRVDDAFLDPIAFRADSVLGVPGLMNAYRAGNVVLANAPGTGVVDDKAMYAYVPKVIRYYLGEEPVLGQVPTYLCRDPEDRAYVLEHLKELVVKPTDGSGGYGLMVGATASYRELVEASEAIRAAPERFIAQPIQRLSTLPTLTRAGDGAIEPRHVDLRPFAVYSAGDRVDVLPGGLTRVALRKGSLVVNSSQGGGSKDTWVLRDEGEAGADA
ncbi:MAG: circularly permuted type 2 ATP-grasp protein [Myxococcota bacterium]|nr:circularly permuted type 2 ATP-grasp protein [Myxococcota bacterium]